jgi:hypothetical protein
MLRFDVFGRVMGVERRGDHWDLYSLENPAARRLLPNVFVPGHLDEDGVGTYLADLFHESARPDRPGVRRV